MLFMFEYGNTKLLIIEQFPNIVDFDVMSLNPCRDALETETVINEVGIKAAGIVKSKRKEGLELKSEMDMRTRVYRSMLWFS